MIDVHRPATLTLRSRTGAAKPGQHVGQLLTPAISPFLVSCSQPKHFPVFGLSTNVFSVKIGRTTALLWFFKIINFRRSKFVCTLSPCPVFGMCAADLATQLTSPVCPVARTQTITLQVVYCKDSVFLNLGRKKICKTRDGQYLFLRAYLLRRRLRFYVGSLHAHEGATTSHLRQPPQEKVNVLGQITFPATKLHGKEVASNQIWVAYVCLSLCST